MDGMSWTGGAHCKRVLDALAADAAVPEALCNRAAVVCRKLLEGWKSRNNPRVQYTRASLRAEALQAYEEATVLQGGKER